MNLKPEVSPVRSIAFRSTEVKVRFFTDTEIIDPNELYPNVYLVVSYMLRTVAVSMT